MIYIYICIYTYIQHISLEFGSSERVFQGVEAVDEAELEAEYSVI